MAAGRSKPSIVEAALYGLKLLCQLTLRSAGQLSHSDPDETHERSIMAESSALPNGQKPTAVLEQDQTRRDILPCSTTENPSAKAASNTRRR
jgi:hypothetical protein